MMWRWLRSWKLPWGQVDEETASIIRGTKRAMSSSPTSFGTGAIGPKRIRGNTQESRELMTVDGAQGEGGGQVLRYAMTCSALTGIPVRVINIRANRPKGGGLRAQHLESAKIVAELTGGCFLEKSLTEGSTELVFDPRGSAASLSGRGSAASLSGRGSAASLSGRGTRRGGEIQGHASTAASITLMLQAALIPAYMRSTENDPVVLRLQGGTDVAFAPLLDYV